jgi:oligoendopeptidase F
VAARHHRFTDLTPLGGTYELPPYFEQDNPLISRHRRSLHLRAMRFETEYRGRINGKKFHAPTIFRAFKEYEEILLHAQRILAFAHAIVAAHTTPAHERFEERVERWYYDKVMAYLWWFPRSLGRLTSSQIRQLRRHRSWTAARRAEVRDEQRLRRHALSDSKEREILRLERDSSIEAERWEHTLGKCLVKVKIDRRYRYLTIEQALERLTDRNHQIRKRVADGLEGVLKDIAPEIAGRYNHLLGLWAKVDKIRRYREPDEEFLKHEHLARRVVEVMTSVALEQHSLLERFFRLRLALMRRQDRYIRRLYFRDIEAAVEPDELVSYDEVVQQKIDAFAKLSPAIAAKLIDFHRGRHVDGVARRNKHINAWTMVLEPGRPVVLLHFLGRSRSKGTIRHEIAGHVPHYLFSGKQGVLGHEPQGPIAELVAVFAQVHCLLEEIEETHGEKRLYLLVALLDELVYNIPQYVAVYLFEYLAHREYRQRGPLSWRRYSELWLTAVKRAFGHAVRLDSHVPFLWAIKTQLTERFYALSYPFGAPNAVWIRSQWRGRRKKRIERQYVSLQEAGRTRTLAQLLHSFGARIQDPEHWHRCYRVIWGYLWEAEQIMREFFEQPEAA